MSKRIFRISAFLVALMTLAGCHGERSMEMGPVETVEAFYKAVSVGEWDRAESLCDTLSLKEYLTTHKNAWKHLEKVDQNAMEVAKSIMTNTTIKIEESNKVDEKRIVTFTIEADGHSKKKKATVAKVEGAWRVEKITEVN